MRLAERTKGTGTPERPPKYRLSRKPPLAAQSWMREAVASQDRQDRGMIAEPLRRSAVIAAMMEVLEHDAGRRWE